MKKLTIFLLTWLFVVAFCFHPGYSASKDGPSLLEKVRKADQTMGKKYPKKCIEDPLREKHMAVSAQCSDEYDACLEKCSAAEKDKEYDTCDNKCKKELSLCEKYLPKDYKTIK